MCLCHWLAFVLQPFYSGEKPYFCIWFCVCVQYVFILCKSTPLPTTQEETHSMHFNIYLCLPQLFALSATKMGTVNLTRQSLICCQFSWNTTNKYIRPTSRTCFLFGFNKMTTYCVYTYIYQLCSQNQHKVKFVPNFFSK